MASTTNTNNNSPAESPAESTAAKSVQKRFEGLVMVRTKAVKGKGAWYWAHLEPILIQSPDSNLPKAVKLRCSLCDAVFSASNPSRTASEHLKRGTCPNFNLAGEEKDDLAPPPPARKRPIPIPISTIPILSGGKDDLAPLAMLEDSVKRLKSPKTNPGPALSRAQVDSAVELLSDWVYESCGSVSLSSLSHPKFRAFLSQVGVSPATMISRRDLVGPRLDSRFDAARAESDARIRDAMFFQLSARGWSRAEPSRADQQQSLVSLSANLPNGTSVYRRAVFVQPGVSSGSRFAENVMWETILGICGTHSGSSASTQRCAGIVSDRFKSKALRNLETQNQWMVNIPCQSRAFRSLLSDFFRNFPLMKSVSAEVAASFLERKSPVFPSAESAFSALDSILSTSPRDDSTTAAVDPAFWPRAEAAHSLAKLIKDFARSVELENPLISRCLPLWDELRAKVRDWRMKHRHVAESDDDESDRIVERRFRKNYRPAWAAAFVLDPLYLVRDASGKFLPPFKCLTGDQERDVDRLITRLVAREEAHVALMELMKWRAEGLDPVYARAVQMRERDPQTGAMRVANPQSGRLVWETHLTHFSALPKVAVRLIFLRATATAGGGAGFEGSPLLRWVTPAGAERAQKLVFVAAHSRSNSGATEFRYDEDARILANEEEEELENKHIVANERPP